MSSTDSGRFDLDADLPTSSRDRVELRRLREVATDDPWSAMQTLHDGLPPGVRAPRRRTAQARPPFEL